MFLPHWVHLNSFAGENTTNAVCESKDKRVKRASFIHIYIYMFIYINGLEENVTGLISKFADDTKVGGFADSDEDHQRISRNM